MKSGQLKHEIILFDLDGTLTDPGIGITNSVGYALSRLGIPLPEREQLYPFIGPPLLHSFQEFYGMDEAMAREAIGYYREYFQATGIFENELYPGVTELLATLSNQNRRLALATSKPTVFAQKILDHFSLSQYFPLVVGSNLDGSQVEKHEVIERVLSLINSSAPTLMVGDRKYDILAAKGLGIEALGVGYGYGSWEELTTAEPHYLVASVHELQMMFGDCL